MNTVITKTYAAPPICEREILRYAGCAADNNEISALMHSCIEDCKNALSYKVCYAELPLSIKDCTCNFGCFSVTSKNLATNLKNCRSVIVFTATAGIALDRIIAKYSKIAPARAIMLQAIGSERVEALCDAFCKDIAEEKNATLRPRFSPGYGDLSLNTQKDIFALLNCQKNISVFLNDSLLMSPSKSVTAFVGIEK